MVDLAAIHLVHMGGVKAITGREPVGEKSFVRELNGRDGPIGGAKLSVAVAAFREIKNPTLLSYQLHCGIKIRKMKEFPRCPYGGKVGCIEAEEVNPGLASVGHVGSNVEFGETRKAGQGGNHAGANSAHPEGNDADPALAIKKIERQLRRDERANLRRSERPVRKQQVVPDLPHDPGSRSDGPGTMVVRMEEGMHAISVAPARDVSVCDCYSTRTADNMRALPCPRLRMC